MTEVICSYSLLWNIGWMCLCLRIDSLTWAQSHITVAPSDHIHVTPQHCRHCSGASGQHRCLLAPRVHFWIVPWTMKQRLPSPIYQMACQSLMFLHNSVHHYFVPSSESATSDCFQINVRCQVSKIVNTFILDVCRDTAYSFHFHSMFIFKGRFVFVSSKYTKAFLLHQMVEGMEDCGNSLGK